MTGEYPNNVQKKIELEEKIIFLNQKIKELIDEKTLFLQLASHELKAPLRKLSTFVGLLENKSANGFDEGTQTYVDRMKKNIAVMQSIIDELTELVSLSGDMKKESCDLNKVLQETIEQFPDSKNADKLIVKSSDLPVIEANFTLMKTLFTNLLDNSIKFQKPGNVPQINIESGELNADEKTFFRLPFEKPYYKIRFADNGIGFSQEDASKVFEPFVRLNGKSEFPGNGLGLCICRKITDLQGGIIYAESNSDGSCFTLILPKLSNKC